MKRWVGPVTVVAFLATGVVLGQSKTYSESTTKEKSSEGTSKTRAKTVTGTVKEYEAGKKIKISGPGDKTYSFDLDGNARVEGNIAAGQTAKVEYTRDSKGKDHVTVLSEGKAGVEPSAHHESQAAEAGASHSGGSMHMESTSKEKSGGKTTKVKTESVIGTVKDYEAGKKITVTGPKNKDYTFNLDENVAMKGSISVGDRVKVSYAKTDGGEKVTTVVPYATTSHSRKTKKAAA